MSNFTEAADMALRLAQNCEREANAFDAQWRRHMLQEARRHRDRAAYWLDRHRLIYGEDKEAAA